MLVAERQQKITKLINEKKSVRVCALSQLFSVTEETIRRDLDKLEKDGKLYRIHGGAQARTDKEPIEISHFEREVIHVEEKKEIALLAVQQIEENDTIMLGASSTALYMARALEDMPITVLTNSIKVAMELSVKQHVMVISTGGTMLHQSLSFVGPLAEYSLGKYHVDKAFISCHSFNLNYGISDSNEMQARMKKKMLQQSETVYIMVDHSKIGRKSFSYIDDVSMIDYVITDRNIGAEAIHRMESKSLQVIMNE